MRVLHSGSLNVKSGGPALSVYLSVKGLEACGAEVAMVTAPKLEGDKLIADDVELHFTEPIRNERLGYMPGLRRLLAGLGEYDLYHVQGLWQYLGHGVASFARSLGCPYVLTLRGMLYPQALAHSKWVKKLSLALYQRRDLQRAACIQATCFEEMAHYRHLGFTNPVAVLPNPIEVGGIVERVIPAKSVVRVGYLGRVHPRKRIEKLIYAFHHLGALVENVELVVIGSGDEVYERFLREEVRRLKLRNVRFTGFLSGGEKDEAITQLSLLCVPSDFENFGNIVSEALIRGVPVIASKGMPWKELEDYHCGWWIDNSQESIDRTLAEALSTSVEERVKMGMNGKRLMIEKYSVEVLGRKMQQLYDWILNGGEKPEFVYT